MSELEVRRLDDRGSGIRLGVTGRLDAHWSDHLARALDEALRDGHHGIMLEMNAVDYMSSAGVRVLLKYSKQLRELGGRLGLETPSEAVRKILELSGLEALFETVTASKAPDTSDGGERSEEKGVEYLRFRLDPSRRLSLSTVGNPGRLGAGGFFESTPLPFSASSFGLGLGAFGRAGERGKNRSGEFIAACGAIACLAADGTNAPDYLIGSPSSSPVIDALYGVKFVGGFSEMIRFEAGKEAVAVSLSTLVARALEACGSDTAGIVMLAESAGLVGASLKKSPELGKGATDLFAFPGIRSWLTFTSERAFSRNLVLVVGVASRSPRPELSAFLRPLSAASGHFHAAAFPYRPLRKGRLELEPTVRSLFEEEALLGLMHLVEDAREISGAGESEFVRGAIWAAPAENAR